MARYQGQVAMEADKRVLTAVQTIKSHLSQVLQEQQKQKQYIKMLMKESRNFQSDVYENFRIMNEQINSLRDSFDNIQDTVDSVNNRSKSIHRHVKGMKVVDPYSDTESNFGKPSILRRNIGRHRSRQTQEAVLGDTNRNPFPLSDENLTGSDTEGSNQGFPTPNSLTASAKMPKDGSSYHSRSAFLPPSHGRQSSSVAYNNRGEHYTDRSSKSASAYNSSPSSTVPQYNLNPGQFNQNPPLDNGSLSPLHSQAAPSHQTMAPVNHLSSVNENLLATEPVNQYNNMPPAAFELPVVERTVPRLSPGPLKNEPPEIEESDSEVELIGLAPLLPDQPNEEDLINLMVRLGLETNPSTISAVKQASYRGTNEQHRVSGLHTVLLLDTSSSMKGGAFRQLQTLLDHFIDNVDYSAAEHGLEESIAVITCGETVQVAQPFTRDYNEIRNVVDNLQANGRTPLMTALVLTLCYIDLHGETEDRHGHQIRPRTVVISDGMATNDHIFSGNDTESSAEKIQVQKKLFDLSAEFGRRNYPIYCAGVKDFNKALLSEIASNSGGAMVGIKNGESVGKYYRYQTVVAKILQQYEAVGASEEVDIELIIDDQVRDANLEQSDRSHVRDVLMTTLLNQESKSPVDFEDPPDISKQQPIPVNIHPDHQRTGQRSHPKSGASNTQVHSTASTAQYDRGQRNSHYVPENTHQTQHNPAGGASLGNTGQRQQHFKYSNFGVPTRGAQAGLRHWDDDPDLSQYTLEERAGLPHIGTRVVRGPHWTAGDDTDGNKAGTIVCHADQGKVIVVWDNKREGVYRYNYQREFYDVNIDNNPRIVDQGDINIGCFVKRGPDWKRGDEDGGFGTVGVVVRKLPGRHVMVRWPSRVIDTYKFGRDGIYELEVTQLHTASVPQTVPGQVPVGIPVTRVNHAAPEIHLTSMPQVASVSQTAPIQQMVSVTTGSDTTQSFPVPMTLRTKSSILALNENEGSFNTPLIHAWQWTEGDTDFWRHFEPEFNDQLEARYQEDREGMVFVKLLGQDVKCSFAVNTYQIVSSGRKGRIQRNLLSQEEFDDAQVLERHIQRGT